MTDPASRGRSLPDRWYISLLLVASLLSIVLAATASTTTGATKTGNDVTHTFPTSDLSNTILNGLGPELAESRDDQRSAEDAPHERRAGQSILHFRGACLENATRCVGNTTSEDGSFFLNAPASGGMFTVSWRPVNDSLRTLRVSIAGLVVEGESPIRVQLEGLAAGEHEIRVEPARRVVGSYDQVVDWTASFVPSTPFSSLETRGRSTYETLAGCALDTCSPRTRYTSDPLVVPWRARGTLTARWDPDDGPRRITIPGTGFVAQEDPPLVIDVSGLTAGEWRVQVDPAGVALPLSTATIIWHAQLVRA